MYPRLLVLRRVRVDRTPTTRTVRTFKSSLKSFRIWEQSLLDCEVVCILWVSLLEFRDLLEINRRLQNCYLYVITKCKSSNNVSGDSRNWDLFYRLNLIFVGCYFFSIFKFSFFFLFHYVLYYLSLFVTLIRTRNSDDVLRV